MSTSRTPAIRTSQTHPLQIASIPTGHGRAPLGITFAPGKIQPGAMTGAWQRDLATDLDAIAAWNAAAVVTLVEPHELSALRIDAIGDEVRRRHMEWHHLPIRDYGVPDDAFMQAWPGTSERLRGLLLCGAPVLVHCKGGLGRAGSVAARLLVELGHAPDAAIALVRAHRPGAIETADQERWIGQGKPMPEHAPQTDHAATRDRAIGALVGLAVGDALGTTLEFSGKPKHAAIFDIAGGGPFGLAPGEWTDDTAMALALADSLLATPHLDQADLMGRFVSWWQAGTYSCTGSCFDIGVTIRSALGRFERSGDPVAGSTDPNTAGNGALMRLAPVAIRHWRDPPMCAAAAALQTRTTHGAAEAVDASILFASVLADAIAGRPRSAVLAPRPALFAGGVQAIASAEWRGKHRDAIRGSGYCVAALEAALWAVSRTTDYRSAVLLAANLGEDADTTAAITGQLAGALYGLSGIPDTWLERLAWRDRIAATADRLFAASDADPIG